MFDFTLAITWLLYMKNHYKAYRSLRGGLWVRFDDGSWVRCKWYYPHVGTLIRHPQDGGQFSVKLNNIVRIETYPWGHTK